MSFCFFCPKQSFSPNFVWGQKNSVWGDNWVEAIKMNFRHKLLLHPVGFEPTTSKKKPHYECGAIDHSAMDAPIPNGIWDQGANFFSVKKRPWLYQRFHSGAFQAQWGKLALETHWFPSPNTVWGRRTTFFVTGRSPLWGKGTAFGRTRTDTSIDISS